MENGITELKPEEVKFFGAPKKEQEPFSPFLPTSKKKVTEAASLRFWNCPCPMLQ